MVACTNVYADLSLRYIHVLLEYEKQPSNTAIGLSESVEEIGGWPFETEMILALSGREGGEGEGGGVVRRGNKEEGNKGRVVVNK